MSLGKLLSFGALLAFAGLAWDCAVLQPTVSAPQQAEVATDAGTLLCEYVRVTEVDQVFYAALCAADDAALARAYAEIARYYPLVEKVAKEELSKGAL